MKKVLGIMKTNKNFKAFNVLLAFIPLINYIINVEINFDYGFSPYDTLWIGFYSCLLIFISYGKTVKDVIIKAVSIIINLPALFPCALGSLMGGWGGLLLTIGGLFLPWSIWVKLLY